MNQFLRDGRAFVAFSRDVIEASAPHIYLSALPFASRESAVISTLGPLFVRLPQAQVLGRAQSTATVLRGHEAPVRTLACSPDAQFLASGSSDMTVRILGCPYWPRSSARIDRSQRRRRRLLTRRIASHFWFA